MNPEKSSENIATNLIPCRLRSYGCTDLIPSNQLAEHYLSEQHIISIIKFICTKRINYESALIDLIIDPIGTAEPLTPAAMVSNDYSTLVQSLTSSIVETIQPSNLTDDIPNTNQTNNSNHLLLRNLILQMDRSSNHSLDLQSYQNQRQLNELMMNDVRGRLTDPSPAADHVNQRTENDREPPSASLQNTIESHGRSITLLQTALAEKSISTDGHLIWHLDKIFRQINDAISENQPHIDSSPLQTSMTGHRLWVRLHLNGKTDPNFISAHVHLYSRTGASFRGTIKFILVDQSDNDPLEHIMKSCSGEMTAVNDCLGFDDFIDRNILHQYGSRYVRDDSIDLLVWVEQTNQEKYANLPPNVQDALMLAQQMH